MTELSGKTPRIAVIGAGAWGIALACVLTRTGRSRRTALWSRSPVEPGTRALPRLPGVELPDGVRVTDDLRDGSILDSDLVLLAVPTQAARGVSDRLEAILPPEVPVVTCCKGLERSTSLFPLEILGETMKGRKAAVLSGPNFAAEIARGLPAATTLASADRSLALDLAERLNSAALRLYASEDVTGVQLGGAAKNVVAIGAGIVIGAGFGENARAALMTRALAETARLAAAIGGNAATLYGLSGAGDLILTCTGPSSRNFSLGVELGQGRTLSDILGARTTVAEGVATAPALLALARRAGVRVPVIEAVCGVLEGTLTVAGARLHLLDRPARLE